MFKVKAQVILIGIFSLLCGMIILFLTLMPLIYQLISLKETTDSYQAIANAEAGIELVFLNKIKNIDIGCNIKQVCNIQNCEFIYNEISTDDGIIKKLLTTGKKGKFERTLVFEYGE